MPSSVSFLSPTRKTGTTTVATPTPAALKTAVENSFPSADELKTLDIDALRLKFAEVQQLATANVDSAATNISNVTTVSTPTRLRHNEIISLKNDSCKPLATIIGQSHSGATLIEAVVELRLRRYFNPCWSQATYIIKETKTDNGRGGFTTNTEDCDLLMDIHLVDHVHMKQIATNRWGDPDAQARSNDGVSIEFATNCFGKLLYDSMDPSFRSTISSKCSEAPTDGQYIWHTAFFEVFPNKLVLEKTLLRSLRTAALAGNDWNKSPDGTHYVTKLQEHLRFDLSITDDDDTKGSFFEVMKDHPDSHIKSFISDLSLQQMDATGSSVDNLKSILSKVDHELRKIIGRNKFLNVSSVSSDRGKTGTETKSSNSSSGIISAMTSDDHSNVHALVASHNKEYDEKLSNVGKAAGGLLSSLATLDRELRELRAKCNRKFAEGNRRNSNNFDRYSPRRDDRGSNGNDDHRPFSWDQPTREKPPFFYTPPPANYHGNGMEWNNKLYHYNPAARDSKGGWYYKSDDKPTDRTVGFAEGNKSDTEMSDGGNTSNTHDSHNRDNNNRRKRRWDNNGSSDRGGRRQQGVTVPESTTNKWGKLSALIATTTTKRHAANNSGTTE
jgi:hypothetical protein